MIIKAKHKNAELDHSYKIMKFMGELVAGGDHEINNLIMMIQGSSRILQDPDSTDEQKNLAVESISNKTNRIKEIMSDLRMILKDGAEDQIKTFYVKDIINKGISLCKTRFKNHRIFISPNISENLQIDANETQLMQAILSILTSSHDAIINNEHRWLKLEVSEDEDSIFFNISDSGNPFSQYDFKNLFNPSYLSNDGRSGLGLNLAKNIIEEHKGKIILSNHNNHPMVRIKMPKHVNLPQNIAQKELKIVEEIEIYNSEVISKKVA